MATTPEDPAVSPDVARVREVIGRLLLDGSVRAADGSLHELFPIAIGEAEGSSLRDWVVREEAVRTLEIGLGYGISALHVLEGLLVVGDPRARHVVIDPFQKSGFLDLGRRALDEAAVSNRVEFYSEESQLVLPGLVTEGREFDLAFVDGNHRFDRVFVDLFYVGRLLRKGGLVFLDDYQLPGIARAANFFVSNCDWAIEETSEFDLVHQWAVLRTSANPDTRSYDFFVDF